MTKFWASDENFQRQKFLPTKFLPLRYLSHDIVLVKLNADGLDIKLLKIFPCYLSNYKHSVCIGNCYRSWNETLTRARQGSLLGPCLFNIFLSYLYIFLNKTDIANYIDV